ncbi:MAG: hypothetical protein JWM59_1934 [Verrucomicrobiales bacterium]|nr:hypothetical protein [Verrucomicrobiales bacterium]
MESDAFLQQGRWPGAGLMGAGAGHFQGRGATPYRAHGETFRRQCFPQVRGWCLDLVKTYGSREELLFLDQTAARPVVTSTIRKAVEESKTAIAARNGEYGSTVREAGAGQ